MSKRIYSSTAIFASLALTAFMISCRNDSAGSNSAKTEVLNPRTELIGRLDRGCLGDSIQVMLMDGVGEGTLKSYPIYDEMFAIPLETNPMLLGSFAITYDGGISSDYFIPEGGKIFIGLNKKGKISIETEVKDSRTQCYRQMAKSLSNKHFSYLHEMDSLAKARGYSNEQKDSLRATLTPVMNEYLKSQALHAAKDPKNKNNIIGITAIMNLLDVADIEQVRAVYKTMGPDVLNHPAVPDSLKRD